jgi:hypothetical protein
MPVKLIVSSTLALFQLAIHECWVWFALDLASAGQMSADLARGNLARFHDGWQSSFTLVGSIVPVLGILRSSVFQADRVPNDALRGRSSRYDVAV